MPRIADAPGSPDERGPWAPFQKTKPGGRSIIARDCEPLLVRTSETPVKKPADSVRFRQSLLKLLESNPRDEDRLLQKFEAHSDEQPPLYSTILYILTHLTFTEAEAERHFKRIRAHRARVKGKLGRDVGLRVAILDYFVNVSRELKSPKVIEISIYQRTEHEAVTDGLTGLYNHAFLTQSLRREVNRARRHDLTFSLLMFDLDNFKQVNDTRGHLEGDRVLVKSAALIRESLRDIDVPARYGGEEFSVILPETPRAGARLAAERIRARVEGHFRKPKRGVAVTISGGIATYPEDATSAEDLLRRADEALYRSKAAGKNRITLLGRERRHHERVVWVQEVMVEDDKGRSAEARIKNASESGLLLSLPSLLPVGSQVRLRIRIKGGAPRDLRGQVVRVVGQDPDTFETGIRLVNGSGGLLPPP